MQVSSVDEVAHWRCGMVRNIIRNLFACPHYRDAHAEHLLCCNGRLKSRKDPHRSDGYRTGPMRTGCNYSLYTNKRSVALDPTVWLAISQRWPSTSRVYSISVWLLLTFVGQSPTGSKKGYDISAETTCSQSGSRSMSTRRRLLSPGRISILDQWLGRETLSVSKEARLLLAMYVTSC